MKNRTAYTLAFAACLALVSVPCIAQGPVVLMSLDAEDGGPDNYHGPSSAYGTVLSTILDHTYTTGSDVLVVGAGKSAGDDVTQFWGRMANWIDHDLYFVNGPDEIANVDLSDYAAVIVASNDVETPDGGLTLSEQYALEQRAADITDFVNSGGGLWGLMQGGFPQPFSYLESMNGFVVDSGHAFRFITPSRAGVRAGVNEVFEVCCWHDEILEYPEFMEVLAVRTKSDAAVAVGGMSTYLGDFMPVSVDFDPKRSPNYLKLNGGKKHVKIAINGTETFDVTTIDAESLEMFGLKPAKHKYADKSTPSVDYFSKHTHYDGAEPIADGFVDLIVSFDAEEFEAQLGSLEVGALSRAQLDGRLVDGSPIRGLDIFELRESKKNKKDKDKKDKKDKKDEKDKGHHGHDESGKKGKGHDNGHGHG